MSVPTLPSIPRSPPADAAPSSAARKPYPPIEPYDGGMLDVGGGHSLYWELCGNPHGKPAVFLHGGPGSGSGPHHRRLFDPERYKVLLFDQRGAGRSVPLGGLEHNTTQDLIADMERLREMIRAPDWLLFGGSWGATLALAYAQAHPRRVTQMILRGVFTGRRGELDWFYAEGGASLVFPDHWEAFVAPIPPLERGDLIAAYRRRLTSGDPAIEGEAAAAWAGWEARTVTLRGGPPRAAGGMAGPATIAFARIENHFFLNELWLEEGQILRKADRLAGIPSIIVQGRYDMVTPAATSHALHRAWPGSQYRLVDGAGHAFSEPGILSALLDALDLYRGG